MTVTAGQVKNKQRAKKRIRAKINYMHNEKQRSCTTLKRKTDCVSPCSWVTGKGCYDSMPVSNVKANSSNTSNKNPDDMFSRLPLELISQIGKDLDQKNMSLMKIVSKDIKEGMNLNPTYTLYERAFVMALAVTYDNDTNFANSIRNWNLTMSGNGIKFILECKTKFVDVRDYGWNCSYSLKVFNEKVGKNTPGFQVNNQDVPKDAFGLLYSLEFTSFEELINTFEYDVIENINNIKFKTHKMTTWKVFEDYEVTKPIHLFKLLMHNFVNAQKLGPSFKPRLIYQYKCNHYYEVSRKGQSRTYDSGEIVSNDINVTGNNIAKCNYLKGLFRTERKLTLSKKYALAQGLYSLFYFPLSQKLVKQRYAKSFVYVFENSFNQILNYFLKKEHADSFREKHQVDSRYIKRVYTAFDIPKERGVKGVLFPVIAQTYFQNMDMPNEEFVLVCPTFDAAMYAIQILKSNDNATGYIRGYHIEKISYSSGRVSDISRVYSVHENI